MAASLPAGAAQAPLRRWPGKVATPPLQLSDLSGREWDAKALRGKVVVLNFWASWCEPCVAELAYLNELANTAFGTEKPVILGINFKESASAVRTFADAHRFEYPILLDKTGDRFKQWTGGVLPTTVLIDRRGRARWRVVGELDREDPALKKALEALFRER